MLLSQVCAACHSVICNSLFPSEPLALQEMNSFRSLQEVNLYFPSHNSWYLLFSKRNYTCLSTINKLNNSLIWNISIFLGRVFALLFNWKYFWGWNLGQMMWWTMCRWHVDKTRVRFEVQDFTGRQTYVVCVSSVHMSSAQSCWTACSCHLHVIWKHVYHLSCHHGIMYIICMSCSPVKSCPKSHSCVISTLSAWPVPRQKLVKSQRNQTNQSKSQINQTNLLVDLALAPETSKR